MTMIQSELKRVTIPQDTNASSDKTEIIMMLWESSAKFGRIGTTGAPGTKP